VPNLLLIVAGSLPCCIRIDSWLSLILDRFDVGGTSTDVSRFDGKYEIVYETTTAGISIQSPQLDINTVRKISRLLMA
jgi:hypothetical protein